MISKEELKPLIQNQETIYYLDGYYNDNIKELKLNDDFGFGYVDIEWSATRCLRQYLHTYYDEDGDECFENEYYLFENLYKTKKDAEWSMKMHDKKTIKFEPPTYEEMTKNNDCSIYEFENFQLITSCFYNYVSLVKHIFGTKNILYKEELTEENYIKVVEYAKGLFKGDKNGY